MSFWLLQTTLTLSIVPMAAHAQPTWAVPPSYESLPKDTSFSIKDRNGVSSQIYTESHAILIMEGHYQSSAFPSVANAAVKAESLLRSRLETRGFHVLVWRDLKSSDLKYTIDKIFTTYGFVRSARIFFYYFGHGEVTDEGDPDLSRAWLVPIDAPDPVRQEAEFDSKAILMSDIVARARGATVKHAFFAFEACYAGNVITSLHSLGGDGPPPPNRQGYLLSSDTQKPVRQFLTAGNAIRQVPANNSFTSLLAGALSDPDADTNQDGYITGKKIMAYVEQRLPQWSTDYPLKPETGSLPFEGGDMVFGPVIQMNLSGHSMSEPPAEAENRAPNMVSPPTTGHPANSVTNPPYSFDLTLTNPPAAQNPGSGQVNPYFHSSFSNTAQRQNWRRTNMQDGQKSSWGVIVGSYGADEAGARNRLTALCSQYQDLDFMVIGTVNPNTKNEHWTIFSAYGLSQGAASRLAASDTIKAVKNDAYPSELEFDPQEYLKPADRCTRY